MPVLCRAGKERLRIRTVRCGGRPGTGAGRGLSTFERGVRGRDREATSRVALGTGFRPKELPRLTAGGVFARRAGPGNHPAVKNAKNRKLIHEPLTS